MKSYSLSAVILLAVLLGTSLSSFRFDYVTPAVKKNSGTNKHVIGSSLINKYILSGSLSGTYPANQGSHNYGPYTLDLSNIPNGSNFTISFSAENVPNQLVVQDGVGHSWSSHNNSYYNTPADGSSYNPPRSDPYNGWVGYTSNPGPWGQNGITGATSGSFSVQKVSGRTYTLQVSTVTNSSTDYWSVTY